MQILSSPNENHIVNDVKRPWGPTINIDCIREDIKMPWKINDNNVICKSVFAQLGHMVYGVWASVIQCLKRVAGMGKI